MRVFLEALGATMRAVGDAFGLSVAVAAVFMILNNVRRLGKIGEYK